MITKPMLSATVHPHQLEKLRWPLLASPKLDGIRCIIHPNLGPVTRSFKPVPNVHVRETLTRLVGDVCLDGELVAVDAGRKPLDFNDTQSAIMSHGGTPEFTYFVFDKVTSTEQPFDERLNNAMRYVDGRCIPELQSVYHVRVDDVEMFMRCSEEWIAMGYEGVMLRDFKGPYKNGRSTLKQQWLVKYKEWADAEGTVIDFEEKMHNSNEDEKDVFGYAKRSSAKAGMVPTGTLGALVLDTQWGELRVGSGFDDSLRQEIWNRNMVKRVSGSGVDEVHQFPESPSETFIVRGKQPDKGRIVTFKYQTFGMKGKPRFPIFKGFREPE